jgi:glycosyltransferase involved in cell wall biosynthesis
MKINIFARPDHSVFLYDSLKKIHDGTIDYYTFYATRQNSILHKILKNRKSVPSQVRTLDLFTLLSYSSNKLGRKLNYNWMKVEQTLCETLLPGKKVKDCDVLHYWPFYCPKFAKKIITEGRVKTVAEFYEAEPSFVNNIYQTEYDKFGLTARKINTLINQNEAFEFERNFIVASEYTKDTYLKLYPKANIHVCSYGPIGNMLRGDIEAKIEKTIDTQKKKIVFVGQVCLEKGAHLLIEASQITGVSVDLIGPIRRGQEQIFLKLIANNKHINYLGPKRNSEVLSLLDQYDIFALPSLSDNYSLAVNEALSRGLPVLVTENCGNKDDIIKFNLGCVSKTANLESLVLCINKITKNFDYQSFANGLNSFFAEENRLQYAKSVLEIYKKL